MPASSAGLDRRGIDLPAQLLQQIGHAIGAALAVAAGVLEAGAEGLVLDVDPVAEDVQVLPALVDGGQLGGPNEPDAGGLGGLLGLDDAVDGVVVAEGQELHAGLGRVGDHRGGVEGAVGVDRVRLEVEGGGAEDAGGDQGGEQERAPDPVQRVVGPDGPWVQLPLGEAGAGTEQEGDVGRGAEGEELPEAGPLRRDLDDGGGEEGEGGDAGEQAARRGREVGGGGA